MWVEKQVLESGHLSGPWTGSQPSNCVILTSFLTLPSLVILIGKLGIKVVIKRIKFKNLLWIARTLRAI